MNLSVNKINLYAIGFECRVFPYNGYTPTTARWFNARYFK